RNAENTFLSHLVFSVLLRISPRLCVNQFKATTHSTPLQLLANLPRLYARLRTGADLSFVTHAALLLQTATLDTVLQHVENEGPAGILVLAVLIVFSIYSWTVIFAKFGA